MFECKATQNLFDTLYEHFQGAAQKDFLSIHQTAPPGQYKSTGQTETQLNQLQE